MALVVKDRVKETTTTTGTGTVTLLGAVTGFQSFSSVGNGNTTYYTISDGTNWEVGIGTYTSASSTLSRDTVLSSSNSGSLVNFGAGTKEVFVTYPSGESVYQDGSAINAGTSILAVSNGGTGASSAASALTNLGAYPSSNPSGYTNNTGTVTSVSGSGGTTGLTLTGGPITTSGTLTLGGTLVVANGGTGATSLSSGYLLKGNGTSAVSASVVYDDGTNVGIGTTSPTVLLDVFSATAANLSVRGNSATNITAHRSSTDATGPNLVLRKSRGTSASQTAVATGDNMGTLVFSAFGGTNNRNIATIASNVEYYVSDSLLSSNLIFSTTSVSTTPTEVMRIDGSGNVGIATASPGAKLDVVAQNAIRATGSQPFLTLRDSGDSNKGSRIQTASGATLFLNDSTGGGTYTERMRIDASGNVGMGTSSPGFKLEALGGIAATSGSNQVVLTTDGSIEITRNTGDAYIDLKNTTGEDFDCRIQSAGTTTPALTFSVNAAERMRITDAGNVGIGTTGPTQKLEVNGQTVTGNITVKGDGSEGGQITLNNAANSAGVYNFDVDGGGNGRIFTTTNNANLQIGQLSGTGGIVSAFTGGSERMRINSSGNVGIGTSNQEARLQVRQDLDGTTGVIIQNRNGSGTPVAALRFITGGLDLADDRYASVASGGVAAADLRFITSSGGPVERMRITSGGLVGIGTSSPQTILHLSTTDQSTNRLRLQNTGSGGGNFDIIGGLAGASNAGLSFFDVTNSATRMYINASGNVGINQTSPSYKLETVQNGTSNVGMRVQNQSTTQYAGSGLAMCGPSVGAGAAMYYYNSNSGGTVGAVSLNRTDVAGNYQATLFNYEYSAHAWQFFTNGTERMRIDSSGNVMIGNSAGAPKFSVTLGTYAWGSAWGSGVAVIGGNGQGSGAGSGGLGITYDDTNGATLGPLIPGVAWKPFRIFSDNIQFNTNGGNERMRIGSNGGVAIGGTGTDASLHIQSSYGGYDRLTQIAPSGTSKNAFNLMAAKDGGGLDIWWTWGVTTGNEWTFQQGVNSGMNSATGIYFTAAAAANKPGGGTWGTTSDIRIKTNITPLTDAASRIMALKPSNFDYRTPEAHAGRVSDRGFIAQEFEEVYPHGVTESSMIPDGEKPFFDEGEKVKMVGLNTDFFADLVALVQEQQTTINDLRARVAQLEGN